MTTDPPDDEELSSFASPPCSLHEFEAADLALNLEDWRKAERSRLIAGRLGMDADRRTRWAARIAAQLDAIIGDVNGLMISVYWPFRGEPDLRPWMKTVADRGGHCALPVVVERGRPLVFRSWAEGESLERGIWNIPIPAAGSDVLPDVVIAPVVGFDDACYRLGYGGGYFDRTLASLHRKPRILGVGYSLQRIPTIRPQPHDVPMDAIVTEALIHRRRRMGPAVEGQSIPR